MPPRDMKALKVKIGLRSDGRGALYPDFDSLPVMQANDYIKWTYYVDKEGTGWLYDRKYGHRDEGPDSPTGMQWGILVIPPEFAEQAVAAFPDTCSIVSEPELSAFVQDRVADAAPENLTDPEALLGLKEQLDLIEALENRGRTLSPNLRGVKTTLLDEIEKALDPASRRPGLVRNPNKTWSRMKARRNMQIKP